MAELVNMMLSLGRGSTEGTKLITAFLEIGNNLSCIRVSSEEEKNSKSPSGLITAVSEDQFHA